jgi:hypothetical protein
MRSFALVAPRSPRMSLTLDAVENNISPIQIVDSAERSRALSREYLREVGPAL